MPWTQEPLTQASFFVTPERAISDRERMLDVLQHWGQQRGEVRFLLRHERAPYRESGESHKHTFFNAHPPPVPWMVNSVVTECVKPEKWESLGRQVCLLAVMCVVYTMFYSITVELKSIQPATILTGRHTS